MAVEKPEPLHVRIGRLRDEARAETAKTGPPAREQVDVMDGSIRVAANLSATGKKDAERRQALNGVQVGNTVTARGAEKTRSTRAEKLTKAIASFAGWTQDQRDEYIASDKFEALSDPQQELISEAFSQLEDRAYENSIGIENVDLDAPTPDVDSIMGDDYQDEFVDDSKEGVADYESLFETASWESEQS